MPPLCPAFWAALYQSSNHEISSHQSSAQQVSMHLQLVGSTRHLCPASVLASVCPPRHKAQASPGSFQFRSRRPSEEGKDPKNYPKDGDGGKSVQGMSIVKTHDGSECDGHVQQALPPGINTIDQHPPDVPPGWGKTHGVKKGMIWDGWRGSGCLKPAACRRSSTRSCLS